MDATSSAISASDWAKGIALSILASVVGGASKLAIRKSWLLQHQHHQVYAQPQQEGNEVESPDATNHGLFSEDRTASTTISSTTTTTINSNFPQDAQNLQEDLLVGEERHEDGGDQLLTSSNCGSCCCYSSRRQRRNDDDGGGGSYYNSTWFPYCIRYGGMLGMSVLNPICCVLAMNYASPSILAPFSGLTLCWVILGSPCVTKEQPSSRQLLACALIIAGEVVVAIFGDHTNDEGVTVEDVRKSYAKPAFLLYFVALVAYVSLLGYWMKYSTSHVLRRFAWGSCGGMVNGAQNFLKDSLTILKDCKQQHHVSLPWFFYFFIICAAGTAFAGLLVLTACMKRYDATYSAASFVGSFVVSASIMASAHYNTFEELNGLINYVLYPTGLVVLMVGVYLLVRESSDDDDDDEEDVVANNDREDKEASEVSPCPKSAFIFPYIPKLDSHHSSRMCLDTPKWTNSMQHWRKKQWYKNSDEGDPLTRSSTRTSYEPLTLGWNCWELLILLT